MEERILMMIVILLGEDERVQARQSTKMKHERDNAEAGDTASMGSK